MRPASDRSGTSATGRLLVVSAGMGAGHDAVAAELVRRLEAMGHRADRVDVLDLLPAGVGAGLRSFYRTTIRRAPVLYAGIYRAFFRPGPGPRPGTAPLAGLAEGSLLNTVERLRPDTVVPVFHLAAQLTGRLRKRGALTVPSAVVVTDFSVHRQWLHPGNDRYLCVSAEAAETVRRTLGRPATATGPVVAARFSAPAPGADDWRRRFTAEAPGQPPVLLSVGAWGAGSRVAETARLLYGGGYLPVVLCGRDERLRRGLARWPEVLALGWEPDMPGLLAASRALVDNAAGQTALEALATGVPVVGYRPIPGHGREGVRRMAALGLSDHATDSWDLLRLLDVLTVPSGTRERRIAAGRELFADDAAARLAEAVRNAAAPR
ncbi:MGDG synthase family glycosyltransferase [Streptomyces sp. NEAU-Y11]|uniref:MGDG synthase family glycosyltransferase n=1 Tax=Streptomyces cucumeris TaxID=2962890 RepID=UPI0020C86BF5|nr:galactosyldiacylglycerol synthase [Streptomyces sp. NEAU-Y11]MCP9210270.1 galactosyldiacylglycerol synthase [Streptomyces sp. NEAU-Y11]